MHIFHVILSEFYFSLDIPLQEFMPLDVKYEPWRVLPLKWVFAYNSLLSDYDILLKAAVVSANLKTTLVPICLFYGPVNDIYHWLITHQVIVIEHKPKWADLFAANAASFQVTHCLLMINVYFLSSN